MPLPPLTDRMRAAIAELQAIEAELERKSSSSSYDAELADQLSLELLDAFKRSLDHMRHLIWPYIIALQQHSSGNVEYALQLYRMQRVREMLKSLKSMERVTENDAPMQLFLAELARMIGPDAKRPPSEEN